MSNDQVTATTAFKAPTALKGGGRTVKRRFAAIKGDGTIEVMEGEPTKVNNPAPYLIT